MPGELGLQHEQVSATATVFSDSAIVSLLPDTARSNRFPEVQITAIHDRLLQLTELAKRREAILSALLERELLTSDLQRQQFRPPPILPRWKISTGLIGSKRRTRGSIAKEKGLETLARLIFRQQKNQLLSPQDSVNPEKEVHSADEALAGARDIKRNGSVTIQPTGPTYVGFLPTKALIVSLVQYRASFLCGWPWSGAGPKRYRLPR